MKKTIVIFLCIILIIISFSNISFATNEPEVFSEAAVLMESDTGKVLYNKNQYEVLYPASLTKILTAIIALEKCDLNEKAVASEKAINSIPANYAIADIHVGEEFTIEQLLNVMLIHSANEAANIIAEHISGTTEEFAKIMNEKAKEIGCKNSNFVNANGVSNENHYSTAYDLALIGKYCIKNEKFREIILKEQYELPATQIYSEPRIFKNTNSLIQKEDRYYYDYCIGGKTGYTSEAENCLIAFSKKQDMTLISVVLKGLVTANSESARNIDTINLFNYGFENYNLTKLKKKGEKVTTVDIKNSEGKTKKVDVVLENDITAINIDKKEAEDVEYKLQLNVDKAPVKQGEIIGTATYCINGENQTSNLLAAETIEESYINNDGYAIFNIIKVICAIIIFIIVVNILKRRNVKRKKEKYLCKIYRSGRGKHSL